MTPATALSQDLELAHELALGASEIALRFFRHELEVRRKPDGTEVTNADLEVERFLVEQLTRHRPGDGILGEELGARGRDERRWILDPIDGTANFIAGRPQWGTHIALESGGEVVLGVISRPARGECWWAARGRGAYKGRVGSPATSAVPIRVSSTATLGASAVAVWAQAPHPSIDRVRTTATLAAADLDAILHLAEGSLDAVVDPTGRVWDHAPAVVLVEEAGGRFSDAESGRRIDRGEGRYSNGLIHDALMRALGGASPTP